MPSMLTIGQLARATGVAARTIRYYEQVGALPRPGRTLSGYRQYPERAVERLLFLRRARALGLTLQQLRVLGDALQNGASPAFRPRLRELVRAHLSTVQQQIADLEFLRRELEQVLDRLITPRSEPYPAHPRVPRGEACRCLETATRALG